MLRLDAGLDDAQLEAVLHDGRATRGRPGAGTGKTPYADRPVARLLERGRRPNGFLLLTFTRRAADDMLARAAFLKWAHP